MNKFSNTDQQKLLVEMTDPQNNTSTYLKTEHAEDMDVKQRPVLLTRPVLLLCVAVMLVLCVGCSVLSTSFVMWKMSAHTIQPLGQRYEGGNVTNLTQQTVVALSQVQSKTSSLRLSSNPYQDIIEQTVSSMFDRKDEETETAASRVTRKRLVDIGVLPSKSLLDYYERELMKYTFADIDYSLLGYNMIRGYPLSEGSDPGLTLPVFSADYSDGLQTADLRYNVPKGLVIIPDISCRVSFTSKIIKSKNELRKSALIQIEAGVKAFVVSFAANAKFKRMSNSITERKATIVISEAGCQYYVMKMTMNDPPPLHKTFLKWLYTLNNTDDGDLYLKFIDTYGTHIMSEVTFGASFVCEYTLEANSNYTKKSTEASLEASAEVSSFVTAKISAKVSQTEEAAGKQFRKNTKKDVITKGSTPPFNGDAMLWASQVKEDPVPIRWTLRSIDTIFSETFMGRYKLDFRRMLGNVKIAITNYCRYIASNSDIQCDESEPGIFFNGTRFTGHMNKTRCTKEECIQTCIHTKGCIGITFCTNCSRTDDTCYFLAEGPFLYQTRRDQTYESYIFLQELRSHVQFYKTTIVGNATALGKKHAKSKNQCTEWCMDDNNCVAYTYNKTEQNSREPNCLVYSDSGIASMHYSKNSHSEILSHQFRTLAAAEETKSALEIALNGSKALVLRNTLVEGDVQMLKYPSTNLSLKNCSENAKAQFARAIEGEDGIRVGCNKVTKTNGTLTAISTPGIHTIVFREKLEKDLRLKETKATQDSELLQELELDEHDCLRLCVEEKRCILYSISEQYPGAHICRLYEHGAVVDLQSETGWETIVLHEKPDETVDMATTPRSFPSSSEGSSHSLIKQRFYTG